MKPFGPLMKEHRRIGRMVALMKKQMEDLKSQKEVDKVFLDRFIRDSVDFFKIYADRTHHGKEEDILFERLKAKNLSQDHRQTMDELTAQHVSARKSVSTLKEQMRLYAGSQETGDKHLQEVIRELDFLVNLYPGHIDKEDNHFFRPVMDYFSEDEQEKMLGDFFAFDRDMVHEKYEKVVAYYENNSF